MHYSGNHQHGQYHTVFIHSFNRTYIKPIKHWFVKVVIPDSMHIESEAWSICNEIASPFPSIPLIPILHRIGVILAFPREVY